jgi:hypothetical protein
MRDVAISALFFSILLASASPVCSQTRPRRVGPAPDTFSESGPRARPEERPREVRGGTTRERAGGGSRWARTLLGIGIAVGAGRSRGCSPSRGRILGLPRYISQDGSPR